MNEINKKETPEEVPVTTPIIPEKIRNVKKITPEMEAKLKAPLPPEAVSPHPTKPYLSTIKAIYVVERLNDVFGIGQWMQRNEVINDEGKMKTIHSFLEVPEYGVYLDNFGGNDNQDEGDAFKGAVTDALTKMASYLGIGMDVYKGLATNGTKPAQPVKQGGGTIKQKELIRDLMTKKGYTLADLEMDGISKNTPAGEVIDYLMAAKSKIAPNGQVMPLQSEFPSDEPDPDFIPKQDKVPQWDIKGMKK